MNCSPELRLGPPVRQFPRRDVWSPNRSLSAHTAGGWSGPRSLNLIGGSSSPLAYSNRQLHDADLAIWEPVPPRRPPARHASILSSGPPSLRWATAAPEPLRPDAAAGLRLWGGQPTMVSYSRYLYGFLARFGFF